MCLGGNSQTKFVQVEYYLLEQMCIILHFTCHWFRDRKGYPSNKNSSSHTRLKENIYLIRLGNITIAISGWNMYRMEHMSTQRVLN